MEWKEFLKVAHPEDIAIKYAQKNFIHRSHRWVGLIFAYVLYHLGISANLIDVGRIAVSFFSLYLLSFILKGNIWLPIFAAFLLYGQHVFDAVDGPVARARRETTKLGEVLDALVDDSSRGATLVLIGLFTQNILIVIVNCFSAFILINLRAAAGSKLPPGFLFKVIMIIFRVSLFIQVMLFIIPLALALMNSFGLSVLIISYVVSFYYLFLAVFWIILCLIFKKNF